MDKFIKLLLETQNTVIIPGLGAIVLDDPETGKLIFNEYLKFNDGKLDAIIVAESNMDLQEAQNYIAKYVREIQTEIDKGESYDIFGLGSIKKDEEGSIHFEGNLNTKGSSQKTKKEEVQGPSPTPIKKEGNKTVSKDTKPSDKKEVASEKDKKETPKASKVTVKKEDADKTKKPLDEKKASGKEKAKKDVAPKNKKEAKKKKKIGVFFWIAIILLLIAGAGGTYIGLNYDQVKEYMGWNQFEGAKELAKDMQDQTTYDDEDDTNINDADDSDVQSEENDEAESDDSFLEVDPIDEEELETDEVEVKETVEVEPEPEPIQEAAPISSGEYHLIAGTFTEKSNAEGLVSELKRQGYPAQIIGYLNGMHYVSVKSFDSASAAQQGINSVQSDVPKAWVYKKP